MFTFKTILESDIEAKDINKYKVIPDSCIFSMVGFDEYHDAALIMNDTFAAGYNSRFPLSKDKAEKKLKLHFLNNLVPPDRTIYRLIDNYSDSLTLIHLDNMFITRLWDITEDELKTFIIDVQGQIKGKQNALRNKS